MKNLVRSILLSSFIAGAIGCSGSSEEAAAEAARVDAADARVDAADANARVKAADAHVRAADAAVDAADADVRAADAAVDAADADDRVKEAAKPSTRNLPNAPRARVVIPSGTTLRVSLLDAIDSNTSSAGDNFLAVLAEPVVIDGVTLLQKGTKVRGRVINADGAGRVQGVASLQLTLTDITQGARMVPITTETFAASADSTQKRDVGVVAGAAGVGAVIGAIAGGKKGAGIGAVTGGGAGTGVILATKGKEIHYGPETRLNFTLAHSLEL